MLSAEDTPPSPVPMPMQIDVKSSYNYISSPTIYRSFMNGVPFSPSVVAAPAAWTAWPTPRIRCPENPPSCVGADSISFGSYCGDEQLGFCSSSRVASRERGSLGLGDWIEEGKEWRCEFWWGGMAMAGGGLGAWRRISDSVARARVVCGVDPSRKSQQSLSCNSNYPSCSLPRRVSISSSGDAVRRCQAVNVTAVRETAEVELRSVEDSRAALRGSFEATSASGCEECGPVSQEEERFLCFAMVETFSATQPQRLYHGRRGGGDGYSGVTPTAKPVTPRVSKSEVLASFEAALYKAGRDAQMVASLAARAWRNLGDADRAEALFLKALELAPQDSAIHASYAEFLWQCDL